MMELAGTEGVLVSGGALTGKSVQFFDLESKRCVFNSLFILNFVIWWYQFTLRKIIHFRSFSNRWKSLPDLSYSTDGHKMVLVEGIPTVFGWEHIEQYDGHQWRVNPTFKLTHSRSAFTVTTVPGHLVPGCFWYGHKLCWLKMTVFINIYTMTSILWHIMRFPRKLNTVYIFVHMNDQI